MSSLQKLYVVNRCEIFISQMTVDLSLFTYIFLSFFHCLDFYRTWLCIWVPRPCLIISLHTGITCVHTRFSVGSVLLIVVVFFVVLVFVLCIVLNVMCVYFSGISGLTFIFCITKFVFLSRSFHYIILWLFVWMVNFPFSFVNK